MAITRIFKWHGWVLLFKWSLTFAACGMCAWGLFAFKTAEISQAMEEEAAWPEPTETVEVVNVEERVFAPSINVIGELVAPEQITFKNELAGQVVAVHFASGDRVAQGEVIIQLDVSTETANLESAKADLTLAQASHRRISKLVRQNATSRSELDRHEATLKIAEAAIKRLQSMIDKKTLRAPFKGTLGLFELSPGQFLDVNTEIVSFVGDGEQIWLDFSVPQFYEGPKLGDAIEATQIRNEMGKDSISVPSTAVVIAKDNVVMTESRSVQYRARLSRQSFRPKQMFEVRVPIGPERQLVSVPSSALQHDTLGQYVFVLVPDQDSRGFRAQRRQVVVREQTRDSVFLSSGLKEGDLVAALGAFKLRDGTLTLANQPQQLTAEAKAISAPEVEESLSEISTREGQ